MFRTEHLVCLFHETLLLSPQQSAGKAKPLELVTAVVSCTILTTQTLSSLSNPPSARPALSRMLRSSLCQQVPWGGQEREGIRAPQSQGRRFSISWKTSALSSSGLQKASTHHPGLWCRVYCWQSELTKTEATHNATEHWAGNAPLVCLQGSRGAHYIHLHCDLTAVLT